MPRKQNTKAAKAKAAPDGEGVPGLVGHILDQHVVTLAFLLFAAVGAEQVVSGHLAFKDLLESVPLGTATAGVAVARALASWNKR